MQKGNPWTNQNGSYRESFANVHGYYETESRADKEE